MGQLRVPPKRLVRDTYLPNLDCFQIDAAALQNTCARSRFQGPSLAIVGYLELSWTTLQTHGGLGGLETTSRKSLTRP